MLNVETVGTFATRCVTGALTWSDRGTAGLKPSRLIAGALVPVPKGPLWVDGVPSFIMRKAEIGSSGVPRVGDASRTKRNWSVAGRCLGWGMSRPVGGANVNIRARGDGFDRL
jgi:hypothetical protein